MDSMKFFTVVLVAGLLCAVVPAQAQEPVVPYIEVTGTSEVTLVPDEIHFIIEIKEYWEEEFEKRAKPEDYQTKVALEDIESGLRSALHGLGITDKDIRTQEVGDYWRERGRDFLVAKQFDITLHDFNKIDEIIGAVDTRGINSMRIGELKHKDMAQYHRQGKIDALLAARAKAEYLAEALGAKLGDAIRIVEPQDASMVPRVANYGKLMATASDASALDAFRTIKLNYSMHVWFELK